MKILFLLGMMFCSTSVGWLIRKTMVARKNYFDDLVKFCQQLSQNIESKKDKVCTFVANHENNYHEHFASDINQFFIKHNGIHFEHLKEEERLQIEQFFLSIGMLTMKEELDNIKAYQIIFTQMQQACSRYVEQYGNLSLKLSSLFGAIICILLY